MYCTCIVYSVTKCAQPTSTLPLDALLAVCVYRMSTCVHPYGCIYVHQL